MACQHEPHEDCMICQVCGKCREDLDDADVCPDCGGKIDGEPRGSDESLLADYDGTCPACGEWGIDGARTHEEDMLLIKMACTACEQEWTEVYELVDVWKE